MLWKADPAFLSFSFFNRFLILLHDSERVTFAQSLISRSIPADSAITLRNIQSTNVILGVLGPNSRELLQSLTQTSMEVNQFPANSAKVNVIHAGVSYTAQCLIVCARLQNVWKLHASGLEITRYGVFKGVPD